MTLLNEVVVLTTPRLSEDIFRPTHYETNLKQGAHTAWPVPVIGSCHYLTHAHSHITRAVAVMDSCFALIGAHQYGIAVIVLSLSRIKMSKIQVNQRWRQSACSLRGRRLKGNGKEIPGAREARKACKGKEKESSPLPYPSRAVSQPNSPPFRTPATQARGNWERSSTRIIMNHFINKVIVDAHLLNFKTRY